MDLALVDFDHTVTTCDTYSRFLRRVATPTQQSACEMEHRAVAGSVTNCGCFLPEALRTRVRPGSCSAGRDAAEIDDAGERHARDLLPGVLRPAMMERIGLAPGARRHRGDRVRLAGCLHAPWCDAHTGWRN
jgi:hypothetical protein